MMTLCRICIGHVPVVNRQTAAIYLWIAPTLAQLRAISRTQKRKTAMKMQFWRSDDGRSVWSSPGLQLRIGATSNLQDLAVAAVFAADAAAAAGTFAAGALVVLVFLCSLLLWVAVPVAAAATAADAAAAAAAAVAASVCNFLSGIAIISLLAPESSEEAVAVEMRATVCPPLAPEMAAPA
mmetsp:Transcript_16324/g.41011  ORF Transcript_16324/g.41011 Transcript_16324/m.41011 type:complete len:181 (+) Transcript_16324:177-719(+)